MYKILTLFANVGIAEERLEKKKFKVVVYNELLAERAKFYNEMYPKVKQVVGDITNKKIKDEIISKSKEEGVDIIMATPPCQGFSVAGKREKDDPRNILIFQTIEIIQKIRPKYVFIENVIQYFKDKVTYKNLEVTIPQVIKDKFKDEYEYRQEILDTKDYGVPQMRKRGFILLSRKDQKTWEFPSKDKKIITVRDAIGDLPSLEPIIKGSGASKQETDILNHKRPIHNSRHIEFMRRTPTGCSAHKNKKHYPKKENGERIKGFATTYKRIDWDKPSPTITMMNGSISSQNNVHPGRINKDGTFSDPRVLSLREIFILTSLPGDWKYPKWASDNLVRHVIGEGIPPLIVRKIFNMIK